MGKKRERSPYEVAARDRLVQRGNEAGRGYLDCVRPIGIEYEAGHAELIGSAVLVSIGERYFALTAGHVADWSDRGALMIAGRTTFFALPPCWGNQQTGQRDDDPVDLAVAEFDAAAVAELGDVRFLTVDDLDVDGHASTLPFYTVVGYPIAQQNHDRARQHFAPVATVYSNVYLPSAEYPKLWKGQFTAAMNLAIRFNPKQVVTSDGIRAIKDQHGLSGGGVFRFERLLDAAERDLLVAITVYAQTHGTKAIVATRINLFLAAILHRYPDLAAVVPPSQTLRVSVTESPVETR